MQDNDVSELTALEAARAIRAGEISAERYAEVLLDRCEALAHLQAFIVIDRDAVLADARRADQELKAGTVRGALHGVLFAVKDNIDVAGLPATAGTPTLRDNCPAADAPVVARLRDAGAIVIGKANMHELAAGVTTDNAAFGTARNPYDEERVPGGSSGGTAVAVSARLAPFGLGTDTGASNRVPAAFCGVVGFRPSVGRWPQSGIIPNSPTRDTAGPMARDVPDCAMVDALVTGDDNLPPVELSRLRLGIPRDYFWSELDSSVEFLAGEWLQLLREAGVTLVEVELPDIAELTRLAGLPIGLFEHEQALGAYLAEANSPHSFTDVLAGVASADVRFFFDEMRDQIGEREYRAAMDSFRPRLQQTYRDYFASNALDGIAFPTSPALAPTIQQCRAKPASGHLGSVMARVIRNTDPGSIAGIPGISIPGGQNPEGLPIGLEIDGPEGSDRRLLSMALAIAPILPRTAKPQTKEVSGKPLFKGNGTNR